MPDLTLVHVVPPSTVARIVPNSPTAYPVVPANDNAFTVLP